MRTKVTPDVIKRAHEIIREVARKYELDFCDLLGHRRTGILVKARFEAYKKVKDLGLSFGQVGTIFNRDHSSVLHGVKKLECWDELIAEQEKKACLSGCKDLKSQNTKRCSAGKTTTLGA